MRPITPSGGIIADLSTGRDVQKHLYNGKELDTASGLNWYDYGARQYDPAAPHFTNPDPMQEKYCNALTKEWDDFMKRKSSEKEIEQFKSQIEMRLFGNKNDTPKR